MSSINITKCVPASPLKDIENPKFGSIFTPHMLRLEIIEGRLTDLKAEILPYADEPMAPSSVVLHYGQSIFEGMKAYKLADGGVGIFRLDLHAKRFANSCRMMAMPILPEEVFASCVKEFVAFERDSVPRLEDHSLYLRPFMFGVDHQIKMGRSKNYLFYVIASIAGNYFAGRSTMGATVLVNRNFVRAYPGGLGEAKTAANYAASLGPLDYAAKLGCDQILYLSAVDHDHVDELGGMNFFIVKNGVLITPPLTGTILDGVTRRSILQLSKDLGLEAREEPISFQKLREQLASGEVSEAFACGTAAVIQPLGRIVYQESLGGTRMDIDLASDFPVARKLLSYLKSVHRGTVANRKDWVFKV